MNDITETSSIQNFSFLNLSAGYYNHESIWSNSFIRPDGNYRSRCSAYMDTISTTNSRSVNLFYIPNVDQVFVYSYLELDKTTIDITITRIDENLIDDINYQINNDDVRVRSMYLNKYEFILLFYIDCDYITDINLYTSWEVENEFIKSFEVKKIKISDASIAFKFFHRFK